MNRGSRKVDFAASSVEVSENPVFRASPLGNEYRGQELQLAGNADIWQMEGWCCIE
jgi:hypothetical protein